MSKKERQNDNNDHEIFELEQELGMSLDEFDVEFPSESEIIMTIDELRPYVPTKENKWETLIASVSSVLKHSLQEIFYFSPLFWGLNVLFIILGVSSAFMYEVNPYVMMLFLAPLPTLVGVIEVFKGGNTEMAELEMSFKYSLQEIILSRMVVVGAFNIFINLLFTISFAVLVPEVMLAKLILYWVTPFTIIAAIMLVVATKFRGAFTFTGGLVLWSVVAFLLAQQDVIERIEAISAWSYILATVAAAIFIIFKMGKIYKRGISHEFNH